MYRAGSRLGHSLLRLGRYTSKCLRWLWEPHHAESQVPLEAVRIFVVVITRGHDWTVDWQSSRDRARVWHSRFWVFVRNGLL